MSAHPATAEVQVGSGQVGVPSTPAPAAVRVEGVSQLFERNRPPVLDQVDLTVAAAKVEPDIGVALEKIGQGRDDDVVGEGGGHVHPQPAAGG